MYLHYNILVYARCAVFLHSIGLTTQFIRENKTVWTVDVCGLLQFSS